MKVLAASRSGKLDKNGVGKHTEALGALILNADMTRQLRGYPGVYLVDILFFVSPRIDNVSKENEPGLQSANRNLHVKHPIQC